MRVGGATIPAQVLSDSGALQGSLMLGLKPPASAVRDGLRVSGEAVGRCRWQPAIKRGGYIRTLSGDLFLIADLRDPDGLRRDLLLSLTEFRGAQATLKTAGGDLVAAVRVALQVEKSEPESDYLDLSEDRYRVELLRVEAPEAAVGMVVIIGGLQLRLSQVDPSGSDGVITRYWGVPL